MNIFDWVIVSILALACLCVLGIAILADSPEDE